MTAATILLFAVLFVSAIYRYIVYPLVGSPLSSIPSAHFTAPLSSFWILWIRYIGKENVTVYDAHMRLGPLVRLGPNEISVNCVDGGIRTVSTSTPLSAPATCTASSQLSRMNVTHLSHVQVAVDTRGVCTKSRG